MRLGHTLSILIHLESAIISIAALAYFARARRPRTLPVDFSGKKISLRREGDIAESPLTVQWCQIVTFKSVQCYPGLI